MRYTRIVNDWINIDPCLEAYKGWLSRYDHSLIVLINEDAMPDSVGQSSKRVLGEYHEPNWDVEIWNLETDDMQILGTEMTYREAMALIREHRTNHNISLNYSDRDVFEYERDYLKDNGEHWNEEAHNAALKLVQEAN